MPGCGYGGGLQPLKKPYRQSKARSPGKADNPIPASNDAHAVDIGRLGGLGAVVLMIIPLAGGRCGGYPA